MCASLFTDHCHVILFFTCLICEVNLDREIVLTAKFSQSTVHSHSYTDGVSLARSGLVPIGRGFPTRKTPSRSPAEVDMGEVNLHLIPTNQNIADTYGTHCASPSERIGEREERERREGGKRGEGRESEEGIWEGGREERKREEGREERKEGGGSGEIKRMGVEKSMSE